MREKKLHPSGTVTIFSCDPKIVRSYDDFLEHVFNLKKKRITLPLLQELSKEKSILGFTRSKNLIVNAGKNQLAELSTGYNAAFFNYVGVGSGTTTPAATDTDLTGPYIGTRVGVSAGYYVATGQAKWDTYFGPSANLGTWYEGGLFNNATIGSGTMLAHTLINPTTGFVKGSSTAVLDWQVDF
ncbi:MAG: hypothetical protein ACYCQJ_15315 [Nitrososphaerales archaeon]